MAHGGSRLNSGRPKGAINIENRAARDLMRSYAYDAALIVKKISKDDNIDPSVRLKASTWIWEQAYGRAKQSVVHEDDYGNALKPVFVSLKTKDEYEKELNETK